MNNIRDILRDPGSPPKDPISLSPTLAALGLAAAGVFAAGSVQAAPFDNVAQSAGVEFQEISEEFQGAPIGAGVAWADFDGDGNDDIYAAQNCGDPDDGILPGNECSATVGCNRMFRNEGGGIFSEVANAGGAALCGEQSRGVAVADFDNDGDQDIFVSQRGQNRLFRNRLTETGTASFIDITASAGMDNDGGRVSSSAVWGDFDKNGYLDLFVGNHRDFSSDASPPGSEPPFICHEDRLWMNHGDGTFTDIGPETGIALSGDLNKVGCALAGAWTDYDNDDDLDLLVQNDFGEINAAPNRLFRNDGPDGLGGWTFSDQSAESEIDYSQAGMGIAVGDLNRDGHFDYYFSDRGPNELALNDQDGTFSEIAGPAGAQAADPEIWGEVGLVSWGNGFYDLDNDGWEDLLVANGGAPRNIWPGGMFGADYIDLNPPYVYRNNGDDTFNELHEALGFTYEGYYRSAAFADFNDDGRMDVYVGNLQGANALYVNNLVSANRWLKVKVAGTVGNRDGIGARINLDAGGVSQMREVSGGTSFLSRHSLTQHFGLGGANKVDTLEVRFLSGLTFPFIDVAVNQTLEVAEPVVTSVLANDTYDVTAGESVVLDVTFTNQTDDGQVFQMWLDHVSPLGTVNTLYGPFDRNMQAGGSAARMLPVPTAAGSQPGSHVLVVRLGTYPDQILHQDHAFVEISAP